MIQKRLLGIAVVLFASTIAAEPEPSIMTKVRALYNRNRAIDVTFSHHTWWAIREREETVDGRIKLAPGNKFRVERGDAQWVSNGKSLWQYSSTTSQVTIRHAEDIDSASSPAALFSQYVDGRKYRRVESSAGQIVVESTDSSGSVGPVRLWIDQKSGHIKKLSFADKNGNRHTYIFLKTQVSSALPEETFEFATPKNAQVLDLRG